MNALTALIDYAVSAGLLEEGERRWGLNAVLEQLRADSIPAVEVPEGAALPVILDALTDDAVARGVLTENSIVYRDLFDTGIM